MQENNHYPRRDRERKEIFSKAVRAGKRTYFFDVKATASNDYYLTITESKKRMGDDGNPFYEKHKIFLYREDFEKFLEGYNETVTRIGELIENGPAPESSPESPAESPSDSSPSSSSDGASFTDVSFDDLK